MKSGALPEEVRKVLQLLADNKVLSKTKPNRMYHTVENDLINIKYDAGKYVCLFLQMRPTKSLTPIPPDSFTTYFGTFSRLYTPFLYPILNPEGDPNFEKFAIVPEFSYGAEIKVLNEIFTKARYVLVKAGLDENLLPQFLALSCSRIAEKSDNGFGETRLNVEGIAKFTTVQIVKYLKETTDVEEIIDMWELGVLPEQYKDFKEYYGDAPLDWVKAIFENNVKAHWVAKSTE